MRFNELYKKQVLPKLKKDFGYKNDLAAPRIEKATVNVGLGPNLKDAKYIDAVAAILVKITGQKPVPTKARKSISSFKIRAGMNIGMKVTLRGKRMEDFIDKLVHVVLPRVRDFRGISQKAVDQNGNLSIGFRESYAFPEINMGEVEVANPLQVVITTTAKSREEGLALFKYLGFPFKSEE